jgi:transglutaminase-like putative cysteine protease
VRLPVFPAHPHAHTEYTVLVTGQATFTTGDQWSGGPKAPELNILVRVGCSLVYEAANPVSLLLNLRPRTDPRQALQQELLGFGTTVASEEFSDVHGNTVHRVALSPGRHEIRHDALVAVSSLPDRSDLGDARPSPPHELPASLLRYTLPSRFCESDKLTDFAWQQFAQYEHGLQRVLAISDWLHRNVEYRFGSGRSDLSAWEVVQRRYGVCRDFAHALVALCRTFNLPARYVSGHLPDVGAPDPAAHMDFHAYAEVWLGGRWHTFDARFNVPRIGRIKVACGLDAVDGAFSTIYGAANLVAFQVWAYQVAQGDVSVGDPIDLSRRLDNRWEVVTGWRR